MNIEHETIAKDLLKRALDRTDEPARAASILMSAAAAILAATINSNPALRDGIPWFDAAHGNLAPAGGPPTIATAWLDSEERALLVAALVALRHGRGREWREACRIANDRGDIEPLLDAYGIEHIKRLARRFGGRARHWMD